MLKTIHGLYLYFKQYSIVLYSVHDLCVCVCVIFCLKWTTDTPLVEVNKNVYFDFEQIDNVVLKWNEWVYRSRTYSEFLGNVPLCKNPLLRLPFRWKKACRQRVYRCCWAKRRDSSMGRIPIAFCPVMTWRRSRNTTYTTEADGLGCLRCYSVGECFVVIVATNTGV